MADGDGETPARTWREVVEELSPEQDSVKAAALIKELNQLMLDEERRKVLKRLSSKRSRHSSAA